MAHVETFSPRVPLFNLFIFLFCLLLRQKERLQREREIYNYIKIVKEREKRRGRIEESRNDKIKIYIRYVRYYLFSCRSIIEN